MSEGNYKDWILETIDQLRNRKARPDLERICHMVERKHGLTFSETEAELEKLVDAEIVIKVDYKGSTSYRNAAKWKKSHVGGQVLNSNQVSRQLHEAMHALTAGESGTGRSRTGTSYSDIESWLVELNGGEVDLEESQLQTALQREVDCRRFEKLPNGNYAFREKEKADKPDRKSGKLLKMVHGNKGGVVGQNSGTSPGKRGRPPTKRKVPKLFLPLFIISLNFFPFFFSLSFCVRSLNDTVLRLLRGISRCLRDTCHRAYTVVSAI